MFVLAGILPAAARQEDDPGDPGLLQLNPEMRNGTWYGSAIASGTADLDAGDLVLVLDLTVHGNFYFDVLRSGETTGSWDIISPSAGTIVVEGQEGAFTLDATYTGTGEVTGDRTHVEANAVVTQDAVVRAGTSVVNADSTDELPSTIEARVTTAFCNEVYGEWDFSWEQTLQEVGWNPSFSGEWVAVRQSEEFEEQVEDGRVRGLTDEIATLTDRWNDEVLPDLKSRDPSTPFDNAEWNMLVELATEFERIQNELRNLTPCDKEILGGAGQVERWMHLMERGVMALIEAAALTGSLTGWDVYQLSALGLRTGGLGISPADGALKSDVMEALRQDAEDYLNGYAVRKQTEDGTEYIAFGTDDPEVREELFWTVHTGMSHIWTFRLSADGFTEEIPAADLIGGMR